MQSPKQADEKTARITAGPRAPHVKARLQESGASRVQLDHTCLESFVCPLAPTSMPNRTRAERPREVNRKDAEDAKDY